jgi:NAD(P)H-hydrate epimerase
MGSCRTTDKQPSKAPTWIMIKPSELTTPLSTRAIRAAEVEGLAQGLPLMLRAGTCVANFLHARISASSHVVALIGPGNNGGDALVAALALKNLGHTLTVVMPVAAPTASVDARQALLQWLVAGGGITQQLPTSRPDAVIDGLFGIGLSRELGQPWQTVIDTVNEWPVPTLAIDIPSGLEADTGKALGRPIKAQWTVSLIAPSLATVSIHGKRFCGDCFVEDLDLAHSIRTPAP